MSLNKKGVPRKEKQTLKGCVVSNGKVYAPLAEISRICQMYPTLTGNDFAKSFYVTSQKELQKKGLPEVVFVHSASVPAKLLKLINKFLDKQK